MHNKFLFIFFVLAFVAGIFLLPTVFLRAQDTASPDALGIRVIPNPKHQSAQNWYLEQGFSGSPQVIEVDGYVGVRDGRTVYVNAGNVDDNTNTLYTNIDLISYNQAASQSTRDIFAAILKNWSFNLNLSASGVCENDNAVNCENDEGCVRDDFCISPKARVIRDVKRLEDLNDINIKLDEYYEQKGNYPKLSSGSYLPNKTISVWPSWQNVLAQELGGQIPKDPINQLGNCSDSRFQSSTCWDNAAYEFDDQNPGRPEIDPPANSLVMIYESESTGQNKSLCAVMESGYISGAGSGACDGSNQFIYNNIFLTDQGQ